MKSTDMARRDRELKRSRKKEFVQERKSQKENRTVGDFINEFAESFFHDDNKIYNIEMSEEILELLEDMKEEMPEKQWANILVKAVKKTKVKEKDEALASLASLAEISIQE